MILNMNWFFGATQVLYFMTHKDLRLALWKSWTWWETLLLIEQAQWSWKCVSMLSGRIITIIEGYIILDSDLGFASQWLIIIGQLELQKRSSSISAIQEVVGYLIVSGIIMILICWAVPVIVVLTKADALRSHALSQLVRDKALTLREAKPRAREFAAEMLSELRARIESQLSGCKYPPKAYLSLASELWINLILLWY